jgi:hypothetical protein
MGKWSIPAFISGILGALAISSSSAQSKPEATFWMWFQQNEDSLLHFERDQHRTLAQLTVELRKVDRKLVFEFGPIEDGRREFTISADGIRETFPKVEALYAAAPALPKWKILKFRQRHEPTDIEIDGVRVQASAVLIAIKDTGRKVDLAVFLPGYSDGAQSAFVTITFLLLDHAVGEYDIESFVGRVDVRNLSEAPSNSLSLRELPVAFDSMVAAQNQKPKTQRASSALN